jgi:protoheme IX farnesyltransferase
MDAMTTHVETLPAEWRDFLALTKPRVMSLVVFTGLCGLLAAAPASIHPILAFTTVLCIALGAGASGALNQWYEADIDALMKRTENRPLPAGRLDRQSALHFGVGLSVASVVILGLATNWLAAAILAGSILFYVIIYTVWLKRRTPQNIVIGGAAGAFPPMIGWAAVTGDLSVLPVLMFALTFLWTPPHFWSLALFVQTDYARAGVPMLPVVAGERTTRTQILLYTLPMIVAAVAPWAMGLTTWIYGGVAAAFSALFLAMALQVGLRTSIEGDGAKPERRLFYFSIFYLFALFLALAVDRMVAV